MAAVDTFPSWVAKVRNDPLGFAGYNTLIQRYRWAEALLAREHHLTSFTASGTGVSGAGGHNAIEIPREVGGVHFTAGAYALEDFRFCQSTTKPAVGACTLNLDADVYLDADQIVVQATNMSETGINKPVITSHVVSASSAVTFYHQYLTSALGAGNAWAAEDANFCAALHGPPLPRGANAAAGTIKQRGNTLTDVSTDYNGLVQADADLRAKFLLEHDSAGNHIAREVAQSWAHVEVQSGGGVYRRLATGTRNALTVSRPGLGICRLTNTTAWTLSAQPFVMLDYQRANGGALEDAYVVCAPRSLVTTTTLDLYIYKYDFATDLWSRADTDFFVAVHGGY